MDYYRRFPGDYGRDTQHLTFEQHGAYTLLLDITYTTEQPLPNDHEKTYRMTRAISDSERAAIDYVLATFFKKTKHGYTHKRVREEITFAESRRQHAAHAARERHSKAAQNMPGACPEQCPNDAIPDNQTTRQPEEEKKHIYAKTWPSDLFLSEAMREYAIAGGVPDPEREFEAWKNDCSAHGRKYLNWMAAWRTRVGNYEKFSGKEKANETVQPKSFDAIRREEGDAATRRILERNRRIVGQTGEALPALPGRVGKADLH